MERVPEIDGLRALAALSVFGYHFFGSPALVRITGAAWIGVDLFFVISGYLITTILLGMRDTPHYFRNFYARRTLRIFPPYYAFLIVCLVYSAFAREYHFSGRMWAAFALYGTSLVVVSPWYPGAVSRLPGPARAMEVTWTLSIEELFYLLWAPAVRFLKKQHLLWLVLAIIGFAPLVRWYVHSAGARTEYYFFPARTDTLAFGALLALVRDRISVPGWSVVAGLAAAAAALFVVAEPEMHAWFAVGGYTVIAASMTLLLGFVLDRAASNDLLCRMLRSGVLVWLGTISYTFYLLHLFMIKIFRLLFANVLVSPWALNRVVQLVGSLGATVLLASLSWKYFESPILRLKKRFQAEGPRSDGRNSTVDSLDNAVSER